MTNAILTGWILLCLVMLLHRRLRSERIAERAPGSWLGIAVQALGFSAVWMMRREAGSLPPAADLALSGLADASALMAIAVGVAAIWTLGRQWSVEGRVLQEHQLVRRGPYAYVRHPIYGAMFGMLVATALSLSSAAGAAAGIALFILGTLVRVHYEEKLLRGRFGAEFDRYAATVPAFLPHVPGRSRSREDRQEVSR
jgi:protein-S-isoprenylcysteine O-methyltransferase Ste14